MQVGISPCHDASLWDRLPLQVHRKAGMVAGFPVSTMVPGSNSASPAPSLYKTWNNRVLPSSDRRHPASISAALPGPHEACQYRRRAAPARSIAHRRGGPCRLTERASPCSPRLCAICRCYANPRRRGQDMCGPIQRCPNRHVAVTTGGILDCDAAPRRWVNAPPANVPEYGEPARHAAHRSSCRPAPAPRHPARARRHL